MFKNICVIVPTCDGGAIWKQAASELSKLQSEHVKVVAIDSESTDSTRQIAVDYGFDVLDVKRTNFNHGGTRNLAAQYCIEKLNAGLLIFLTQDAILQSAETVIAEITKAFSADTKLSALYGRQLPHDNANAIAQHARYYNYKNSGYKATPENHKAMGLKAVFLSNSFAVYSVDIFIQLNGFPENTILCEDMFYAAKSIQNGFAIAYCPDVAVKHSHNYSPVDEFKRYFDIGVFHAEEPWIGKYFGGASGEGKNFLISEFKFLLKNKPLLMLNASVNNAMKILGYKIGKNYKKLPASLCKKLSMHKAYWK